MKARLGEEWAVLLLAVQFLTRLPVPDPGWSPARMAAATRWHPAVGAAIGGLAGLGFWLAEPVWGAMLAALLSTAFGLLLTGALHEDGFADACDGLGGGATRERALAIMRDSRLGTYGGAGLGLMLGGKVLALAVLGGLAPLALIGGHAAGRASSVLVIATGIYARDHGTGKPVAEGIGRGGLGFALASGGAAVLPVGLAGGFGAVAAGLAGLALGHLAMRWRFERKLGGYTGDCLGAVQQASEIGFYLGLLAWL